MAIPNVGMTVLDGGLGIIQPSTSNVQVKLGVCSLGTVGTLYSLTSPSQALAALGSGPLTEAVAYSLAVAGGVVLAMPVTGSSVGTVGAVTHTGALGTGVVSVTGVPLDASSVVVAPVTSGIKGVGTFKYSMDGGNSYSATLTIPSSGTYVIPNSGLTLGFDAGTFVPPDTYAFTAVEPKFQTTDVTTALTTLLTLSTDWGWVHVVGTEDTVAHAAALATAVETSMESAASVNFRYAHAVIEVPDDTDANLATAFANVATARVMVCAGSEQLTSVLTGNSIKRNSAWTATARQALVPISQDLGQVSTGSIPGVNSLNRDEAATPALDALNFTTLRTFVGMPGFYITSGHMFVAPGSDFKPSQNRRVMDQACKVARLGLLKYLNGSLRLNKSNGTILELDARTIETFVGGQLNASIVAPGDASFATIVIDRSNNILSTSTILYSVRIIPLGYAKIISGTIGFVNPALQLLAA